MDDRQTRITHIGPTTETEILAHIVDAMLAAERELRSASVQEWDRVLTQSCRVRKRVDDEMLATPC